MSITPEPPQPPAPPVRSGCATAIMIVIGIVLLLPGLCALIFGGMALTGGGGRTPSDVLSFIGLGLVAGGVGVLLIWGAIRDRRR